MIDLDELPPGWRWESVGELSDRVSVGYVSSTRAFFCASGDGVPLIRSQNIRPGRLVLDDVAWVTRDFHDANPKSQLRPGDVLITRVGANAGDVCIVPNGVGELHLSSAVFARPKPTHRKYLELFFRSPLGQYALKSRIVGSVSERINTRDVESLSVLLPPKFEEAAIAHILGMLDDKIELNRRMNETLEAMARALFKSWFVDFEPVRAKTEGRNPGLPAHLADLFPDALVESELGEIPEGWEVRACSNIAEVNPRRKLKKGSEAPYLAMANMPTRGHAPGRFVRRAFGSGMKFINGDTLVARITPCLENGKTALVDFLHEGESGWGSTEYIVLRPLDPCPPEFGYCLARSDEFRTYAIQRMTGSSGRQRVPADAIAAFELAIAPAKVYESFGRLVRPIFMRARHGMEESRTLTGLRDSLLPKLISGELRIQDAETFIERTIS